LPFLPFPFPRLPRPARPARGFTLIETLVVLTISVGLVALMAALYRAVAQAAVALRGGNPEWALQITLREQLANGVGGPKRTWLGGDRGELTFLTWKGRAAGFAGPPVVAQYICDAAANEMQYREAALPPWWGDPLPASLGQLATDLRAQPAVKLVGNIGECDFAYHAADAPASGQGHWGQAAAPALVSLRLARIRENRYWFDLHGRDF
jgi:prepilin-type N-terminal cleavage/methylation domain-containing protein